MGPLVQGCLAKPTVGELDLGANSAPSADIGFGAFPEEHTSVNLTPL